jgi:hypothetical protein
MTGSRRMWIGESMYEFDSARDRDRQFFGVALPKPDGFKEVTGKVQSVERGQGAKLTCGKSIKVTADAHRVCKTVSVELGLTDLAVPWA